MVGGDEEDVGLAHQLDRLERPVREWGAAERQVERTAFDRFVELRIGPWLGQPELDPPANGRRNRLITSGTMRAPTLW